MNKKSIAEILEKAESENKNIKEKQTFYIKNIYIILMLILIFVFEILRYSILKYTINYVSFIDFYTSPAMYLENSINFMILVAFVGFIIYNSIKINLAKNFIKLEWNKKIYFNDILEFRIRENKTFEIAMGNGETIQKSCDINNYENFLFIIKKQLGEKFIIVKYPKYEKEKTFPTEVLKIVVIIFVLSIINKVNDKIIKNYAFESDFSKYGMVREKLNNKKYAEINYKHGKKNGISRYYNTEINSMREVEYKQDEEQFERIYNEDRILVSQIDCKKGEKLIYYPNGNIFIKINFSENKKVIPPVRVYDSAGKLRIEERYLKSCDCVVWKIFADNKTIIQKFSEEKWKNIYVWKQHLPNYFERKEIFQEEVEMFNEILELCNKEK